MAVAALKRRLREGEPLLGTWVTLGSTAGAQYLAYQGFDWLGIDLEEYPAVGGQATRVIEAIRTTPAMPLVRSRRADTSAINAAMSTGATGIFIPRVRAADQAAMLLAPFSKRSDDDWLQIVMIETERGFHHAEDILAVPGIDACFLAPGETGHLSMAGQGRDAATPELSARLRNILAICRARGIAPGIHVTTTRQAVARMAEGWQLVAVGTDGGMLTQAASDAVQEVRRAWGERSPANAMRRQAFEAGYALAGTYELGGY